MHDTPPPPPAHQRDDETLLADLCIALRDVGVRDGDLPAGQRVLSGIEDVRSVYGELQRRGIDPTARLDELSVQTRWRMNDLLRDCLAFPRTLPYVKEADGIRRFLRCILCHKAERPPDSTQFWMCDGCLRRVTEAIERREPIDGIVLFRTYNAEARCAHADAETVLATYSWASDIVFGNCGWCFHEEVGRRAAHLGA